MKRIGAVGLAALLLQLHPLSAYASDEPAPTHTLKPSQPVQLTLSPGGTARLRVDLPLQGSWYWRIAESGGDTAAYLPSPGDGLEKINSPMAGQSVELIPITGTTAPHADIVIENLETGNYPSDLAIEVLPWWLVDQVQSTVLDTAFTAARLYGDASSENLANVPRQYRVAAAALANTNDDEFHDLHARTLVQLGIAETENRNHVAAVRVLEAALPIIEKYDAGNLKTTTLIQLIFANTYLGQYEAAEKNLSEAQAAAANDPRLMSAQLLSECYLSLRRGNRPESRDCHFRLIDHAKKHSDYSMIARARNNIGGSYQDGGNPEQALPHFEAALVAQRTLGDKSQIVRLLGNLAIAYRNVGEHQIAIDYNLQALDLLDELGNPDDRGRILANLGSVYSTLGEYPRAMQFFDASLPLRRSAGQKRGEATVLNRLATLHRIAGRHETALDLSSRAYAISEKINNPSLSARALHGQSLALIDRGDYKKAEQKLLEALRHYRSRNLNPAIASVLQSLGRLSFVQRDYESAETHLNEALTLREGLVDKSGLARTLELLARVKQAIGQHDEALSLASRAVSSIDALRTNIDNADLRASYAGAGSSAYDLLIHLMMAAAKEPKDQSQAVDTLEVVERYRARSLVELLSTTNAAAESKKSGVPANLLDERRQLLRQLNGLASRQQAGKRDEIELSYLLTQIDDLDNRINAIDTNFAALRTTPEYSLQSTQAMLDNDELLLQYFLGEKSSYLWVLSSDDVRWYTLPSRAKLEWLAKNTHAALGDLTAPERPALRANLQRLSRALLGPISDVIDEHEQLIVIGDGALNYLPFDALPHPGTGDEVVATHVVSYLPSVSALQVRRALAAKRVVPDGTVAVLADPVFSAGDPRLRHLRASNTGGSTRRSSQAGRLNRLIVSKHEAEAIIGLVGKKKSLLLAGFEANRDNFLEKNLTDYATLHIATHGTVNAEFPQLSGLTLSQLDQNGETVEGFVSLKDIYDLRLNADLVVLSACDTALGRQIRGEGLLGLTRGFMYAGADRVIASLWQVQDRATAQLMTRFYNALIDDGESAAVALREAKLTLRSQNRLRDPYYWAGFTLQGEWR